MSAECENGSIDIRGVRIEVALVFIAKKDGLLTLGFGKGLVELCALVKETGSLNKAAREMGMSYSKALRIVHNAEEVLGVELLCRQGAKGSTITEEAQELISSYRSIRCRLSDEAEAMVLEMIDRIHECSK